MKFIAYSIVYYCLDRCWQIYNGINKFTKADEVVESCSVFLKVWNCTLKVCATSDVFATE